MNDVGSIAQDIVTYSFPDDTGRFPVSFVSGWLETHVGEFNGLTHECFFLDATGAFQPYPLAPVEEDIFKMLYEISFYDRSAREALRGIVWGGASSEASNLFTLIREGDSTIQRTSKHLISKNFSELAKDSKERLKDLLFQYNMQKSAPRQVSGEDGSEHAYHWDSEVENRT